MNVLQVFSLFSLAVLAANAQVIAPGRCPDAAVQQKFDAARYLGKWYEIQRMPTTFQKGQCSEANYSLQSPGVVGVLNRELLNNGTIYELAGAAKPSADEPAKLTVTFTGIDSPPAPYWVLSTDYDNYALVYSCTEFGSIRGDFSWILSRQPTLPAETLDQLHSILTSNGVNAGKLLTTNHDADYCASMSQ